MHNTGQPGFLTSGEQGNTAALGTGLEFSICSAWETLVNAKLLSPRIQETRAACRTLMSAEEPGPRTVLATLWSDHEHSEARNPDKSQGLSYTLF